MGNPLIKHHPHTGKRLEPLYVRRDGRPCWPILGASPDDPPAGDPPAGDPPSGDQPPSDPPADPSKTPPWGKPENFDADKAWELIQNLRTEKGDPARVSQLEQQLADLKTGQQTQMDALAKALGLKSDDPPDPGKLAAEIEAERGKVTEAETRAAAAERKLAVVVAAMEHEGNVAALLDSSSFLGSITEIDPTDADAIGTAVKKAVDEHDHFRVTKTPSFNGGPRKTSGKPDPGPGLPRLRDAYAQSSK